MLSQYQILKQIHHSWHHHPRFDQYHHTTISIAQIIWDSQVFCYSPLEQEPAGLHPQKKRLLTSQRRPPPELPKSFTIPNS